MNSRCKVGLAPQSQMKLLFHISVGRANSFSISLLETVAAIHSSVGSRCPYGLPSVVYISLGWCIQDRTWFESILIKFSLKSTPSFTWFWVYSELHCVLFINHHHIWHLQHATQDWHNMIAVWAWTALGQPASLTGLPTSQNQRCGPNKCKHRGWRE